jgi:hypothetical protein
MYDDAQEADRDELRKQREQRAKRYNIAAKSSGHLTPPQDYPSDEALYGDPVNYRYPADTTARARAAITRFNDSSNRTDGGYNNAEWAVIGRRIAKLASDKLDADYVYADGRVQRKEAEHHVVSVQGLHLSEAAKKTGRKWDVTVMGPTPETPLVAIQGREYVQSRNRRLYAIDGLRESVPLWDGVKVYDNHLTPDEFAQRAGMRSFLGEGVGVLTEPYFDEDTKSLRARLSVVDNAAAQKLLEAWNADVLKHIGLSVDTLPKMGRSIRYEGEEWPVLEGFERIFSVDVVSNPAAGGAFNRLLETRQTQSEEEQAMELTDEKLKDMVSKAVADALAAQQESQEAEEEDESEESGDDVEQEAEGAKDAGEGQGQEADPDPDTQPSVDAKALEHEVALLKCERMLDRRLEAAKLPDKLAQTVREAFEGRVFEKEELEKVVKRAKEAQAETDKSGEVKGAGADGIRSSFEGRHEAEVAFMEWMGGSAFRGLESADSYEVKDRLPEAYHAWIKAGKPAYTRMRRMSEFVYDLFGGDPLMNPHVIEAQTTSDLTSIIKNTVNLMIAADYSQRERWYEPLVQIEEVDTIDDATLVRMYGLDSLDVVNEGAPYTEVDADDEEETASFVKKGNYIGITLETMMRDKVQFVRSLPRRLSAAWYNTLSDLVSGVFTVNSATGPDLSDGGALFNATAVSSAGGHANLGTTALSYATYDAAVTAMLKQTDQPLGAGRKLLARPRYLLVPVDLRATALQIRNSEAVPGTADNEINPYYQAFDVVEVPTWTDTNNWAAMADPQQFPAIYLIFPRGQRVPQIFAAENDTAGALFTHDEIRYKVRMMTYRFSSSYECAPVADFRPLYKANVS